MKETKPFRVSGSFKEPNTQNNGLLSYQAHRVCCEAQNHALRSAQASMTAGRALSPGPCLVAPGVHPCWPLSQSAALPSLPLQSCAFRLPPGKQAAREPLSSTPHTAFVAKMSHHVTHALTLYSAVRPPGRPRILPCMSTCTDVGSGLSPPGPAVLGTGFRGPVAWGSVLQIQGPHAACRVAPSHLQASKPPFQPLRP